MNLGHYCYISWRRDRHVWWSSEPHEGLTVGRGKSGTFISQLFEDPEYWSCRGWIEPRDLPLTVKPSTDWTNTAAIDVQNFSGAVAKPVSSGEVTHTKVLVLLADLIKSIYQRKKVEKLTYRTLTLRRNVSTVLIACHLSSLLTLVNCLHQLWKSFINSDWNSLFSQIGKLPVSSSVWFWVSLFLHLNFWKSEKENYWTLCECIFRILSFFQLSNVFTKIDNKPHRL